MLRSLKDLERYEVRASDGDLGRVADFLLDDEHWAIRYLVVETGAFFKSRRVLVSPISFRHADWSTHRFHVGLTIERLKSSLSVDLDKPVCRQNEHDQALHYDYAFYWGYIGLWGQGPSPGLLAAGAKMETRALHSDKPNDVHLRSVNEILRYHVHASDGPAAQKKSPDLADFAGHVSDSGEGRWTLKAAIDEGVPAPALSSALAQRFASRGEEDFASKLLSALRDQFGGHQEKH